LGIAAMNEAERMANVTNQERPQRAAALPSADHHPG
jgi:hypothetical protein